MFRRPKDENPPPYKYGVKTPEPDIPPRIFDTPPQTRPAPIEEPSTLPHHFQGIADHEDPETTLGEGVTFRGELSFERLLRIDGTFEGDLLSQGKVIVGPKGKVKANLNLREAIVEGEIEGDITCQERLELRGQASVIGDIHAKSLSVDDGVKILGTVHVDPTE